MVTAPLAIDGSPPQSFPVYERLALPWCPVQLEPNWEELLDTRAMVLWPSLNNLPWGTVKSQQVNCGDHLCVQANFEKMTADWLYGCSTQYSFSEFSWLWASCSPTVWEYCTYLKTTTAITPFTPPQKKLRGSQPSKVKSSVSSLDNLCLTSARYYFPFSLCLPIISEPLTNKIILCSVFCFVFLSPKLGSWCVNKSGLSNIARVVNTGEQEGCVNNELDRDTSACLLMAPFWEMPGLASKSDLTREEEWEKKKISLRVKHLSKSRI